MTISYFGYSANPVDNSALDDSADRVWTPPSSMLANDFCVLYVSQRDPGATLTNKVTGGQTWSAGTAIASGSQQVRRFTCTYNGTWSANPEFGTSFSGGLRFSIIGVVFRPSGTPTWATDVAQNSGNATPSTPFDVTATGQTAVASSTVTIACWFNTSFDGEVFSLQTGGWTNPGGVSQFRNKVSASNDMTLSLAYKINSAAGTTGNVTNRMTQSITTLWMIETFKDQSASASVTPPGIEARVLRRRIA